MKILFLLSFLLSTFVAYGQRTNPGYGNVDLVERNKGGSDFDSACYLPDRFPITYTSKDSFGLIWANRADRHLYWHSGVRREKMYSSLEVDSIIATIVISGGGISLGQMNDSLAKVFFKRDSNTVKNAITYSYYWANLTFSNLTGKPTTLSGYGITDSVILRAELRDSLNDLFWNLQGNIDSTAENVRLWGYNSFILKTDATVAATADKIVRRDAYSNAYVKNVFEIGTSTLANNNIVIMDSASSRFQEMVGTGGNTVTYRLPNATGLINLTAYEFDNNSDGQMLIKTHGDTYITTIDPGGIYTVRLKENFTANGVWDKHPHLPAGTQADAGGIDVDGHGDFTGNISANNYSGNSSGTNTGDQLIVFQGDVSGSGYDTITVTLNMQQADGDTDGYLDSLDWDHFNEAYNKYVNSGSYSGGIITLTRRDGTTFTITGLVSTSNSLSDFAAPTSNLSMGSHKITNVTDPTSAQDAMTKNYGDVTYAPLAGVSTTFLIPKLTVNRQSGTTYTTVLSDAGKWVISNNASAVTITIPPNSSVAYPTDTYIHFGNEGAGKVTISPGSGVTISGTDANRSFVQYADGYIRKTGTDTWIIGGKTSN